MSTSHYSSPAFDEAYRNLNDRQKEAVDYLEGPLLVIAGPGTGKTQILAIRIGNILLHTDYSPRNILCLTYTENGAINMRQRLLEFIGPTAYEITICTFHSFCNMVIKENPESFDQYSSFEVISELEKSQLLIKMMESLDRNHPFYRYNGNYKNELSRLTRLFEKIKKENWNPQQMIQDIDQHLEELKSSPEYIYKRKSGQNKAGDFNQAKYDTDKKKFERTKTAIQLYTVYLSELDRAERYEFEDMIRWVLDKFETDEALLAKYQERYQSILVDEFQDTNGAQNQLLNKLISFFDTPNIFAVGDDDQAIFRFQGANVQNMMDFQKQYQPTKIVLTQNYRSSQHILNAADAVIVNNTERLSNLDNHLVKSLEAAGKFKDHPLQPVYSAFENQEAEILHICKHIKQLIDDGVPGNEIAILFLKNKDAEPFIKWFEYNHIPYQTSREINVLHDLFIRHLLNILEFVCNEYTDPYSQDQLLYKILHAPFIPVDSETISKLAWYIQLKRVDLMSDSLKVSKLSLLNCLSDELELTNAGINDQQALLNVAQTIHQLKEQVLDLTPQMALEKILVDFNILSFIIGSLDKVYYLQLVNSFFEFLKSESQKNPLLDLPAFLILIKDYIDNGIQLPLTQFIGTRKGVVLSTIYKAKGLEYDHVFMINNSADFWKSSKDNSFTLMSPYKNESIDSDEDKRRLFYVGLTRARISLNLSFHKYKSSEKKPNTLCKFILEMLEHDSLVEKKIIIEPDEILDKILIDLSPVKKDYQQLEDQLFEQFLDRFSLNPTALSKYLKCPLSFYYEKVLQIPAARTPALGFGNAVHYGLELFMKNRIAFQQKEYHAVINYFRKGMEKYRSHFTNREFENYLAEGERVLPLFIKNYADEWQTHLDFSSELKIKTEYKGVPISGKLDRVDTLKYGIKVIDYKTGKPDASKKIKAPEDKHPFGTDYWQQMVFYSILLKMHGPTSKSDSVSTLYFVIPNSSEKFEFKEISPSAEQLEFIGNLIVDTYAKIKRKEFTPGCGKSDCEWCNYVNSGVPIHLAEPEENEDFEGASDN